MARIFKRVAITFLAVFFILCFAQWCGNRPVSLDKLDADAFKTFEYIESYLDPLMREEDIVSLRIREGVISYLNEFSGERKILTSGKLYEFLNKNRNILNEVKFEYAMFWIREDILIMPIGKFMNDERAISREVQAGYDPKGRYQEGDEIEFNPKSKFIDITKVIKREGNIVIFEELRSRVRPD